MLRRRLIACGLSALTLAAVPAFAQPSKPPAALALSADDQALVDRATAYLDGLSEARGRFVQTDARGAVSQGELYLSRPGKARFEYQNPPTLLVVADGRSVAVLDRRLKTFNRYALSSTPLALFLQKRVRLDQKLQVTRVERSSGGFSITAHSSGHGARGQITLSFSDNPVALTQWSLVDAGGARTTVRILDLQTAHGLDPGLFELNDPSRPGSL
ncbi:MAG TPA: outer membrane lipoprotein carrier protein LolA [Caulobacteraceae bacterium]